MIPQPATTLSEFAVRLATRLLPELGTVYAQADAALLSGLLETLAQDFERAVDNRMQDIQEMQAIFAEAVDHDTAADTSTPLPERGALTEFTARAPVSFRLEDVTALHAEGFSLLITLHAWVEKHDATLNDKVWALLHKHCERNKFEVPGP